MPRLRGAPTQPPSGDAAWPLLNEALFGSNWRGGHDCAIRSEVLPWDWSKAFGREAPRTLEIGFNRGMFLSALAARWPDHDHVGIEIRRKFCWRLAQVVAEHPEGPRNLRLLWADAQLVTAALFVPGSLAHVFVNFPDPWWKRKHAKRRLVNEDFAQVLHRQLQPGGWVWVKSDVPAIAEEIGESLAATPGFGPRVPFGLDDLPLTYRETSCLRAGLPIERYKVQRLPE